MSLIVDTIQFVLPDQLSCPKPTELRNIARDDVRLLVTNASGEVVHTHFRRLFDHLDAGDVVVVNTSATQPAAIPVQLPDGARGMLHFSTQIGHHRWLVEIRKIERNKTYRWKEGKRNLKFNLPEDASITLKSRFYEDRGMLHLWEANLESNEDLITYMHKHGRPIQYEDLNNSYPLDYYQTIFSFHPGSSEMPSAGRGFTRSLVDRLLHQGVVFAPVLLHTGISSLEENESPYPEYYEIDPLAAAIINNAKKRGKRIVAVGTTVVRALESAVNNRGIVVPFKGETNLFIKHDFQMKVVNSLLTGFHEPRASHLHMLLALAGFEHIEKAYTVALEHDYFWHQFGDIHLINAQVD